MSPVRGRLYTRYGFTACLLFVHCAFAHDAHMARSLPAAGRSTACSSIVRCFVWTVAGYFNDRSRPLSRRASDACSRSVQQKPESGAVMVRPWSSCGSFTQSLLRVSSQCTDCSPRKLNLSESLRLQATGASGAHQISDMRLPRTVPTV